jgi:EAL domain-containing protein (putative c-di-GMP-specific phosphodiesterase class I)
MVRSLGIISLAEGVETEPEDAVCRQMGFDLGQGFLYGRPAPIR